MYPAPVCLMLSFRQLSERVNDDESVIADVCLSHWERGQVQRCKSKRCVFSKGDLEGRLSLSVYVCVCLSVFLPYMFVTCRYILMSACQGSNHLGDKHLGMPVRAFPERVYLRREDQP